MVGLTLQALRPGEAAEGWMSCSLFQTLFPFPRGFHFRHRQGVLQQHLLGTVNALSCPLDYLCTPLLFLSKGRWVGKRSRIPPVHLPYHSGLLNTFPCQSFSTGSCHSIHAEKFLPRANFMWSARLSPCPDIVQLFAQKLSCCLSPSQFSQLLITLWITLLCFGKDLTTNIPTPLPRGISCSCSLTPNPSLIMLLKKPQNSAVSQQPSSVTHTGHEKQWKQEWQKWQRQKMMV